MKTLSATQMDKAMQKANEYYIRYVRDDNSQMDAEEAKAAVLDFLKDGKMSVYESVAINHYFAQSVDAGGREVLRAVSKLYDLPDAETAAAISGCLSRTWSPSNRLGPDPITDAQVQGAIDAAKAGDGILSPAEKAQIARDIGVGPVSKQALELMKRAGIPRMQGGAIESFAMHDRPIVTQTQKDLFVWRSKDGVIVIDRRNDPVTVTRQVGKTSYPLSYQELNYVRYYFNNTPDVYGGLADTLNRLASSR